MLNYLHAKLRRKLLTNNGLLWRIIWTNIAFTLFYIIF